MTDNARYYVTGFAVGVVCTLALKRPVLHFLHVTKAIVSSSGSMKMVIVMRPDLSMTRGKISAQAAHAAVSCYKAASISAPIQLKAWEMLGQPKIVVRTNDIGDKELITLSQKAKRLGVINTLVRDAGKTQIQSGTVTCLGLGPAQSSVIDSISGHLKLL